MSTVQDDTAFDYASIKIELEAYLGFDVKVEPRLELWYNSAREQASRYLANGFVDADGVDVAKPEGVKLGIFEGVRAQAVHGDKAAGVTKVKTAQLEETYGGPLTLGAVAVQAMLDYLWPLRLEVQLG